MLPKVIGEPESVMSKLLLSILDSAQRVCGLEYQLNGAGLLYPAELRDHLEQIYF
jgi:hypothetical protein